MSKNWHIEGRGESTIFKRVRYGFGNDIQPDVSVDGSVAEPEPPEPYNFDPRKTGTVSLL